MKPADVAATPRADHGSVTMPCTAVVTGASRGIGLAVAELLARQGFGLTISARDRAALNSAAEHLRKSGAPQVHVVPADAADAEQTMSVIETHSAAFGSLDVLVVNAGVGSAGPLASTPLPRARKTFNVNVLAPVVLIQNSLPMLRETAMAGRHARIIALSSITGVYAEPELAVYGASKAALLSLIDTVNAEESGNGVTATCIAPAYVDTDMSTWVTDEVAAATMISTADIVHVVEMALKLSPQAVLGRIILSRAGTTGYCA